MTKVRGKPRTQVKSGGLPIPNDLKFGDILHGVDGSRFIVGVCSSWYEADGVTLRVEIPTYFPYSADRRQIYCLREGEKDGDIGIRLVDGSRAGITPFISSWEHV